MFRYGQGTDYFGYKIIYDNSTSNLNSIFDTFSFSGFLQKDILYDFLMYVFKAMKLNFEIFIMFISVFQMYSLYKFVNKYSKYKISSLFMFYSVYWLFFDSGVRQGIAMAIFMGFVLPAIIKNHRFKAIILIFVSTMFHSSAIILLPVVLISKTKVFGIKKIYLAIFTLFLLGFTPIVEFITTILPFGIDSRVSSYLETDIGILPILNRFLLFIIVLFIYYITRKSEKSKSDTLLLNLYIIGFLIYSFSFRFPLIAGRISVYYRFIEVIIIPNLLYTLNKSSTYSYNRSLIKKNLAIYTFLVVSLFSINWIKNIDSFIDQGQYLEANIFNYEYVSIFNKEKIYEIRNRGIS
jgi:hypothetical protein